MKSALSPFFTYYGGKYRAALRYPAPTHQYIVEPFAGAAGYALRHPYHDVVLVEKDQKIAAVWRYILTATSADVLSLPLIGDGWATTDDLTHLDPGARFLIGLWLNKGSATPHKSPSAWARDPRYSNQFWGEGVRDRIASQVGQVRHWQLIEGDYSAAPRLLDATWFIDPPYIDAGRHYPTGAKGIDYAHLAEWARSRRGQVMVCEALGAEWLPFSPFGAIKATSGRGRAGVSHEVIWQNVDEVADGNAA